MSKQKGRGKTGLTMEQIHQRHLQRIAEQSAKSHGHSSQGGLRSGGGPHAATIGADAKDLARLKEIHSTEFKRPITNAERAEADSLASKAFKFSDAEVAAYARKLKKTDDRYARSAGAKKDNLSPISEYMDQARKELRMKALKKRGLDYDDEPNERE